LHIADIAAVVKIAKENNLVTVKNNPFATQFNQRPIDYGVAVVVRSATKYLGGHSDLVAVAMIGSKALLPTFTKFTIFV